MAKLSWDKLTPGRVAIGRLNGEPAVQIAYTRAWPDTWARGWYVNLLPTGRSVGGRFKTLAEAKKASKTAIAEETP